MPTLLRLNEFSTINNYRTTHLPGDYHYATCYTDPETGLTKFAYLPRGRSIQLTVQHHDLALPLSIRAEDWKTRDEHDFTQILPRYINELLPKITLPNMSLAQPLSLTVNSRNIEIGEVFRAQSNKILREIVGVDLNGILGSLIKEGYTTPETV